MLDIEHLSFSLGDFSFSDLNLHVNEGEYVILLGPTGAGKTILLETIAGIYQPYSGRILLNGEDITRLPPEKRGIGMVYQDYMLFPHMTVADNIGFGLRQKGVPKAECLAAVATMAEMLGIAHLLERYPKTLSGGEQQRAAIGRALLLKPAVLLLDEPLSALDTRTREILRDELRRIHQETGVTILHITHHFEDMYSLADSVVVMREGSIVQTGTPDDILSRPSTDFIAEFTGMENVFSGTASDAADGMASVQVGDCRILAVTPHRGTVHLGIRPENILLSCERIESSAQNSFAGVVQRVIANGAYVKVLVDCGTVFSVVLTKHSVERLGVFEGETVWVTFKATAVHVYKQ